MKHTDTRAVPPTSKTYFDANTYLFITAFRQKYSPYSIASSDKPAAAKTCSSVGAR